MSKVYMSVTFSRLTLGLLTGIYLGVIYGLFNEKILNIYNLGLGELGSFLGGVFSPILFMFIAIQHFSQQEQLLEVRNKEKEKEEEKTKLAQPYLKIQDFRYKYQTEKKFNSVGEELENLPCSNLSFILKNLGTSTHSIKITIDTLDFEENLIEVLNYSDEKEFQNIEIPKIDIKTKNITIKFIYLDYYREIRSKFFLINLVNDTDKKCLIATDTKHFKSDKELINYLEPRKKSIWQWR